MFCENCGAQLKEGARFCARCGTPVAQSGGAATPGTSVAAGPAAGAQVSRMQEAPRRSSQAGGAREGGAFDGAVRAGRRRGRGKMSPIMVVALVLALLTGTALAAHFIYQNVYLPSVQQEQAASESSSAAASAAAEEEQPHELEAVDLIRMGHEAAGETLSGLFDCDNNCFATTEPVYEAAMSVSQEDTIAWHLFVYQALEDYGGSMMELRSADGGSDPDAGNASGWGAVEFDQTRVIDEVPDAAALVSMARGYGAEHFLVLVGDAAKDSDELYDAKLYYTLEGGYEGEVCFYEFSHYFGGIFSSVDGVGREDHVSEEHGDFWYFVSDVKYDGLEYALAEWGVDEDHRDDVYYE